jgi:ketosteroid isomerase-like protein
MKHKLGLCLLITLQALGVGCSSTPDTTSAITRESDVAAVRALISREQAAFNSRDLDALQGLLTHDAIEMSPIGPDVIGSASIRAGVENTGRKRSAHTTPCAPA